MQGPRRRRDRARHARRLHPRPRLPPRLLPARGERHRLRRRRRRRADPGDEPGRPADAAARHRRRDLGATRSRSSKPGARAPRGHPLRRDRRRRPSTWPRSASASREEAQLARELDEAAYEKRHRALVARRADTEEAAEELIQCVPPAVPVARPRPLLAQAGRAGRPQAPRSAPGREGAPVLELRSPRRAGSLSDERRAPCASVHV